MGVRAPGASITAAPVFSEMPEGVTVTRTVTQQQKTPFPIQKERLS
jgi:hypothetical protein